MSSFARRIAGLTPKQRALLKLKRARAKAETPDENKIQPREGQGPWPASLDQAALWFFYKLNPQNCAYNIPSVERYRNPFRVHPMQRAMDVLLQRHEILRTVFVEIGGKPYQEVRDHLPVPVWLIDLSNLPPEEREARARALIVQMVNVPFDLEQGPLLRLALIRLAEDDHLLLKILHHTITDWWSFQVFTSELMDVYMSALHGSQLDLPAMPISFLDYAVWRNQWCQGPACRAQLDYWLDQLEGAPTILDIPTDRPYPPKLSYRGSREYFFIPEATGQAIRALGKETRCTTMMVLLGAMFVFLSRYTGARDILVGTTVTNRENTDLERLIGYLLNILVLRGNLEGNPSFRQIMERVREMVLGAFAHSDLPFKMLVEKLNPVRDLSRMPVYQVEFLYVGPQSPTMEGAQTANVMRDPDGNPLDRAAFDLDRGTAAIDLQFGFNEMPDRFRLGIEYQQDLFDRETVRAMGERYMGCLAALLDQPHCPIADLAWTSAGEVRQMMAWAHTSAMDPVGLPPYRRFLAQVSESSEKTALVFGDQEWTYQTLGDHALRLSNLLIQSGIGLETPVGICMARGPAMVVAVLGVHLAGAVYVPMESHQPIDRLRAVAQEARLGLVICDSSTAVLWVDSNIETLVDPLEAAADCGTRDPGVIVSPDQLAYVIFTSGSTGRPKGVALTHGNLSNLLEAVREQPGMTAEDRLMAVASLAFDLSVYDLFMPLLHGAVLVIAPKSVANDGAALAKALDHHQITVMQSTASTYQMLLAGGWQGNRAMRAYSSGERLPQELSDRLCGVLGQMWNHYGPTETTIWTSGRQMRAGERVVLGSPFINTEYFVVDTQLRLQPIGVPGELLIGGANLARGYLHQPGLTAEKFVPNPFAEEGPAPAVLGRSSRLYRSGDLVRYRPDGALVFISRIDFQVKIRGFRIELGEVESTLAFCPGVAAAVAVVRRVQGDDRLVAYVVPDEEQAGEREETNEESLRRQIGRRLPEYMMPSRIVFIPALPLTANLKLDRKALPEPEWESQSQTFEAPQTSTEKAFAAIWQEVLGVERVSRHDDFFALGGHSLLATQALARVREDMQGELPLAAMFEGKTLAELSGQIEAGRKDPSHSAPVPVPRDQFLPLSFFQNQIWLAEQMGAEGNTAYHVPMPYVIHGPLDAGRLSRTFHRLVQDHEILRTVFRVNEERGEPEQVILPHNPPFFRVLDLRGLPARQRDLERTELVWHETHRPFNLEKGPLIRVLLVLMGAEEAYFQVTMHHLTTDGWSTSLLQKQWVDGYQANPAVSESGLAAGIQYADFAVWQAQRLETDDDLLAFWRSALAGAPERSELPTTFPRNPEVGAGADAFQVPLPDLLVQPLRQLASTEQTTFFTLMLAAFQCMVHRLSGQPDFLLGTPVSNRPHKNLESVIGHFVNNLVLRSRLSSLPFSEHLKTTGKGLREALAHQDLPFQNLVERLQPERVPGANPFFQISFGLINPPVDEYPMGDCRLVPVLRENQVVQFDMVAEVFDMPDGRVLISMKYSTGLFDEATIAGFMETYLAILETVAEQPGAVLTELPLVRGTTQQRLLARWQPRGETYPRDSCLTVEFAQAAARMGESEALCWEGGSLTYAELDRRANQLAHTLIARGASGPVGLCLAPGCDFITALLAVVKAGCTYVPLDPDYPAERLLFMIEDTGITALVAQAQTLDLLPAFQTAFLNPILIDEEAEEIAAAPVSDPGCAVPAEFPAYIIYTSGSTGKPKGVSICQRNVLRLVHDRNYVDLGAGKGIAQISNTAFDALTFEVWTSLLLGGRLCLVAKDDVLDAARFETAIAKLGIDGFFITAALFDRHVAARPQMFAGLDYVIVGGDKVPVERARAVLQHPPKNLRNGYGPTECTTFALWHPIRQVPEQLERIPIGTPIAHTSALILDRHLAALPDQVPGELFLAGDGLAAGYHNRPGLTALKFLPHPFADGERIYATGDLARHLADGTVDFLGRGDGQVKLRGYRVELGEIEQLLLEHTETGQALVRAEDHEGGPRLLAYATAKHPTTALEGSALKSWLGER